MLLVFQAMSYLLVAQTNDHKYDFPIKPGSEVWKAFTTHQQMVEATTLPAKTAASLTTKALLETCLDYPLLGDIMMYNSPQKGLEKLIGHFNGLSVLMERKEVALYAANAYQRLLQTDVKKLPSLQEKGKLTFQLSFIELLLSQKKVLAGVSGKDIGVLKTYIGTARTLKTSNKDIFGTMSYGYTMYLAGNLFRTIYRTAFSPAAVSFLNTGAMADIAILEEIDNATR